MTDARMYSLQLSDVELRAIIRSLRYRAAFIVHDSEPLKGSELNALANHLASKLRG